MKTGILLVLLGSHSLMFADSFIRVINQSSVPVQGIWQASGCWGIAYDWNGDTQLTVCWDSIIEPGTEDRNDFSPMFGDRSVKVLLRSGERIGYCNSMDYASITILDSPDGGVMTENHCP